RASSDRILDIGEKGLTLFTWLAALPVQGSYTLEVQGRKGKRTQHQALMQVRFAKTKIKRPHACTDKNAASSHELWAIEVQEDASTVVGKEKPIHWRLLTTHPIESMEQARQCVQWYCQRWHIEQTFRTLKRQGLNVESSMVEEARRLEKVAVLGLSAAVHTMQLTLAREGTTDRPASDCVNPADYPMLEQLCLAKEGKTQKQKNPHAKHTLGWLERLRQRTQARPHPPRWRTCMGGAD
ncbi:MAG: transposase, partial [Rhodoferax sp.]|nr:transposase [Rhodoferax sp.]